MARPLLQPRERKLAVVAAVVIVTWAVVSWIGLPLWDRFHVLQQQAAISEKKLARLRELVLRKPSIERQYQASTTFWSDESDEVLQGAFLDELEQMAGEGHLQISVKPRPIQREGRVSRFGVEVEVDGTQEALFGFLNRLLTSPNLVEVSRLRISTTVSKDSPLRGSLLVSKVVFHH